VGVRSINELFRTLRHRAAKSLGVQRALSDLEKDRERLNWLIALRDGAEATPFIAYCSKMFAVSRAQILQDLFVLFATSEPDAGFFVEFGATDGVSLSNTWLLEKKYGWKGILAEPARRWHNALRENRQSAIDTRCVWSETGKQIQFNETVEAEFSTIDAYSKLDGHASVRADGSRYVVSTISLEDLLIHHNAPRHIEYLSLDTEGTELEILSGFNFKKFSFSVITVEHNYLEDRRNKMHELLVANGYRRVLPHLSAWDDWYVNKDLPIEA
jgi:FkbM family methyltransferase